MNEITQSETIASQRLPGLESPARRLLMFPTIFALSIKQLGRYTKLGSSLLVASILGGAIFPAIMGFISDHSNIRVAFVVPLICQAYVLYFAVRGYRPVFVAGSRTAELSTVK